MVDGWFAAGGRLDYGMECTRPTTSSLQGPSPTEYAPHYYDNIHGKMIRTCIHAWDIYIRPRRSGPAPNDKNHGPLPWKHHIIYHYQKQKGWAAVNTNASNHQKDVEQIMDVRSVCFRTFMGYMLLFLVKSLFQPFRKQFKQARKEWIKDRFLHQQTTFSLWYDKWTGCHAMIFPYRPRPSQGSLKATSF